jgi:hypothetical protein
VVEEQSTNFAIIELQPKKKAKQHNAQKFQRLSAGELLPDGSIITKIEKDSIEYQSNGVVNTRRLFDRQ